MDCQRERQVQHEYDRATLRKEEAFLKKAIPIRQVGSMMPLGLKGRLKESMCQRRRV